MEVPRIQIDDDFLKAEARFMDLKESARDLELLIQGLKKGGLALMQAGRNANLSKFQLSRIHFGWEESNFREILLEINATMVAVEDEIIRFMVVENFAKGSAFHRVDIMRDDGGTIWATLVHEPDFEPKYKTHGMQSIEGHNFILKTRVFDQAAAA